MRSCLLSTAGGRRFGEERKNEMGGGGTEKGKHRIKIAWLYDSIKKGSG